MVFEYKCQEMEQQDIIREYQVGLKAVLIADKHSINRSTIYDYLKKHNISTKGGGLSNRKYNVNELRFNSIDNEESAYWLGFISADGNITKYELRVTLASKDKNHLQKLANFLNTDKKIKSIDNNGYPASSLIIASISIIKSLNQYGIKHNKTYNLIFPANILKSYIRDYIGGYFDGDGSAYISDKYKTPNISFVGNKNFLIQLKEIIKQNTGVDSNIRPHSKSKYAFYLIYRGQFKVKPVVKFLYHGANIYLERKKEVINDFLPPKRNNYPSAKYYCESVGHISEDTVKKYIEDQTGK